MSKESERIVEGLKNIIDIQRRRDYELGKHRFKIEDFIPVVGLLNYSGRTGMIYDDSLGRSPSSTIWRFRTLFLYNTLGLPGAAYGLYKILEPFVNN